MQRVIKSSFTPLLLTASLQQTVRMQDGAGEASIVGRTRLRVLPSKKIDPCRVCGLRLDLSYHTLPHTPTQPLPFWRGGTPVNLISTACRPSTSGRASIVQSLSFFAIPANHRRLKIRLLTGLNWHRETVDSSISKITSTSSPSVTPYKAAPTALSCAPSHGSFIIIVVWHITAQSAFY